MTRVLVCAALALSASGCNAIFGVDELHTEGVQASNSTSSVGGAGGSGPASSSGVGGQVGNGGAGGCADCLVDRGLVVRYFIDEADSGQAPTMLIDAAPDPLPLTIEYGPGTTLTFIGSPGKRGLLWSTAGSAARAIAPILGTKIVPMLDGSAEATIEMVVELTDATTQPSNVVMIGSGGNSGSLSFVATPTQVGFFWKDAVSIGSWNVPVVNVGRVVVHAVLEATHSDPLMRTRLYVNAVQHLDDQPLVGNGEVIDLSGDTTLVVGSGITAARSPQGIIAYIAYYNVALTDADILVNVARLNASDDTQ